MSIGVAFNALLLVGPAISDSIPGSIRSQLSGKCWDLPGGDSGNGNKIWQWNCAGTDNQRWTFDADSFTLRMSTNLDKCVDVNGNDFTNGVQPQIWDCAGTPQQMVGIDETFGTIYFAGTATSSDASKCVDLYGGGLDDGNPLVVWDCLGDANQQWWYTPDAGPAPPPPPTPDSPVSYIKSKETSKCLDVPGGNVEDGQQLWIWECNEASPNQKWLFKDGAIILSADQSKCVDLPNSDTTNGNLLQIWDCSGLPQQMWGFDSDRNSIYMSQSSSDATKCFQMQDGSGISGTPLEIWDCLPYGNQQWYLETAASSIVVT